MTNSQKKQGLIAGIALIIMAISAGLSFGYIHNSLIVDSPEITFTNLIQNTNLYYLEILGWSIIFITDLIVAVSLFLFFSRVSKKISFITAFIRIVYTLILGVAIFQLIKVIPLISSENQTPEIINLITLNFQSFEKFWSLGLIIFGFHLLGLGYLSLKSKTIPCLLGYLLYFGGAGYSFLNISNWLSLFLSPTLDSIESIIAAPMALSEILLAFWLIYAGLKRTSEKK